MEVVDRDDLVRVDEPGRERRPDEPGAAGDEDPLSRQGHPRIVDAPGGGIGGRGCRRPGFSLVPPPPLDRCRHNLSCRSPSVSGRRPPPHGSKPNETTVSGGTRLRAAFVPIAPHAHAARPRPRIYDRAVSSVLFVGAGRHQRRAIAQARERGLRVVAVDRNADAPGLALADVPEVVDFADVDACRGRRTAARRGRRADGLRRPGGAGRRRRQRAARAAHDRDGRRPPHDQQDRDAPYARGGRRPAAAVRSSPQSRGGTRCTGHGRPSGRPQARRLRRAARSLPDRDRGRPRVAPPLGARRVARPRGDPRGVRRGNRDERHRRRAERRRPDGDALRPPPAGRRRLRRGLDPPLSGVDPLRPARARRAGRGALGRRARAAESGSPSRS